MQIVTNDTSSRLRRKALQDPKYSVANMLIDGRKYETSSAQAVGIEEQFKTRENINATAMATPTEKKCYYCGFKYPHDNQPFPAKSTAFLNYLALYIDTFDSIHHKNDVNEKLITLNDALITTLDIHAPVKTFKIKSRPCPYVTVEIIKRS